MARKEIGEITKEIRNGIGEIETVEFLNRDISLDQLLGVLYSLEEKKPYFERYVSPCSEVFLYRKNGKPCLIAYTQEQKDFAKDFTRLSKASWLYELHNTFAKSGVLMVVGGGMLAALLVGMAAGAVIGDYIAPNDESYQEKSELAGFFISFFFLVY